MNDTNPDRRSFLKSGIAGAASIGAFGNTARASDDTAYRYLGEKARRGPFTVKPGRRPHIFLISADMISPDCHLPSRPMAEHVNLPNIRGIAGEGVRFDNALCTSPLCGPSRASIFTGRYPPYLTNGERAPLGMKTDLGPEDVIFQEYVRASGYVTRHVGKCHVGADTFLKAFGENDDAWNRWAPPVMEDDDYVAFLNEKGIEPPVLKRELRGKQYDRTSPGNSYGGWIEQADGRPFPLDAHYSVYLARKAAAKLDAALDHGGGEPVYLQLDFFDPHQPYSIPSGLEDRAEYLREHIRIHDSWRRVDRNGFRALPGEPDIYSVYRRYWGAYDPELVRDYMLGHFLQMEVVDHAVGILLEAIRRRGIRDDSLIIFTGDHGEINGRLALFDKGVYFQPDIFRVPLFIKPPAGAASSTRTVEAPVSSMDISRTVLAAAGIDVPGHFDGENLLPVINGRSERPPLNQVFQTGWHVGVNYGAGVNWFESPERHWFFGYNISSGTCELYNMARDDCVNLLGDPAYKDTGERMIRLLGSILAGDRRWLGYWSTYRLHMAEHLPDSGGDMQMFVPVKQ